VVTPAQQQLSPDADTEPVSAAWAWCAEIWEVQRRRMLMLSRELDLSPPQMYALRHLQPGRPRPMGDLARYLVCDNSNLTGVTDRLEKRGLVERRQGEADRRVKMLVLTDDGAALRALILERIREPIPGFDMLEPDDRDQLLALLERVATSVLEADPLEPTAGITR
jgi:DNA-binding MarR family transcriptional regulator